MTPQAILYQNGKAVGRLLTPQLSSAHARDEGCSWLTKRSESGSCGVVVEAVSLVYQQWQPVWLKDRGASKNLYIPVDSTFTSSHYTLQVIGRSGGRPFVVPFAYQFSGREVALALGLEAQRADYILQHQLLRKSRSSASSTCRQNLAVECGKGFKGLTAVFDAEDQPAWLKSVALRFAVVASKSLDDSVPNRGHQSMQAEQSTTPNDKPSAPPSSQSAADQAAKESWLSSMPSQAPSSKKLKAKPKGKGLEKGKAQSTAAGSSMPTASDAAESASAAPSKLSQPGEVVAGAGEHLQKGAQAFESRDQIVAQSQAIESPLTATGAASGRSSSPAGITGAASSSQAASESLTTAPGDLEPSRRQAANDSLLAQLQRGQPARPPIPGPGKDTSGLGGGELSDHSSPAGSMPQNLQAAKGKNKSPRHTNAPGNQAPTASVPPKTQIPFGLQSSSRDVKEDPIRKHSSGGSLAAIRGEESPSDDSMVTATSGQAPSSPNTDTQSVRPSAPQGGRSGSAGSSEASSFPTAGSLGSEVASGDEEAANVSTLPGFSQLPNGVAVAQPRLSPLPGASRPVKDPELSGHATRGPSQQWSQAGLSPSASISDLQGRTNALLANGARPDLISLMALGGRPFSQQFGSQQQGNLNARGQRTEARSSRPYDPLSLVGSPMSPKDFSPPWGASETLHWTQGLPLPHYSTPPREGPNMERSAAEKSLQLSNGLPWLMLPVQSTPQQPHSEQETGASAGLRARTRPQSTAESVIDLESRADSARATTRSLPEWVRERGPPSGPTLPAHLFRPHPHAPESQTGRFLLSPPQSSLAEPQSSAISMLNSAGFAQPPAQLRMATGPSDARSGEEGSYAPSGQHYDGSVRTRSHDSAVDPGARALIADLRHARAAAAAAEMGRIMTPPPPPPPPRTPPPHRGDFDSFDSSIERQSSFQVPRPPNHSAFDGHGLPSNDLERLMSCVTPVLQLNGELAKGQEACASLCLADVWRFFEEASAYGREVYTRSGQRGAALAYYTPTLSAIRVLLPCHPPQGRDAAKHAKPLIQHFESELPFNREPFTDAMATLAADKSVLSREWQELRLSELHPESWFAVAWYPVYRIPDAPLTAKFLTFHSLKPVPACQTYFGAVDPLRPAPADAAESDGSPLCTPILGLKCAEQKGEQWFETYQRSTAARIDWEVIGLPASCGHLVICNNSYLEQIYNHIEDCARSKEEGFDLVSLCTAELKDSLPQYRAKVRLQAREQLLRRCLLEAVNL